MLDRIERGLAPQHSWVTRLSDSKGGEPFVREKAVVPEAGEACFYSAAGDLLLG